MATIIDAFIVTLGLDAGGFQKGTKETEASQKKMRDDTQKTGKEFEAQGKKMAESVAAVRDQIIAMVAAFAAAEGIKQFVADITLATQRSVAPLGTSA